MPNPNVSSAAPSAAALANANLPQTFEHKESLHVTIPSDQQVGEVRLPLILPTPQLFGVNVKVLPIRVAVEHIYSSCYHSIAVDFSFGCPDYQTISLCANPLTQGLYHQDECALVIPGGYGGFNQYFGTEDGLVIHDRTSKLRKLSEEVDTTYFGVQPADVFAKAPRTLINGARHVLILTEEFNYASDAILQYLNDNRHLPLFRDACQIVPGGVYAVRELDWNDIFAPFIEKLKDIDFIENNQFVSFRRVDGHPFGAMPKYWEGDYMEANLVDPHSIDLTMVIHYLILKPNLDPNALRNKYPDTSLTHAVSHQMAMAMNTADSYLPSRTPQTFVGNYGMPMTHNMPLYNNPMTAANISMPSGPMEMTQPMADQGYSHSYSGIQQRANTATGYPRYL